MQIEQGQSLDPSSTESTSGSRRTSTESSTDCVNGICDMSMRREVGLLGSYAILPDQEAWILTNAADLSCETIQWYDVTATFENGQQETKVGVNLCEQDHIFFGQPKQGEQRHIAIANATDQSSLEKNLVLQKLYITPSQSNTWGYNLLESRAIGPGEESLITFIDITDQCSHDIRAVFVNPNRVDHLEPVQWHGIDLCNLDGDRLVYGIPLEANSGGVPYTAIALVPQSLKLATKQLSRSKAEVCLSSSNSRVCQPARRRTTSTQRPWWQIWRQPSG